MHRRIFALAVPAALLIIITLPGLRALAEEESGFPLPFRVAYDAVSRTEGIAACANGRLFTALNQGGKVLELTEDGEAVEFLTGFPGQLVGMACDDENRLYINGVDPERKGVVYRADMEGGLEIIADGMILPNGLALAPDGSILVSDSDARANAIYRIDPHGERTPWLEKIPYPNGLGFSPDGDFLYVCNTFANRITRVPVDEELNPGEPETFAVGVPTADGLMVLADGRILAVSFGAGSALLFDPDGERTVLARGMSTAASPAIRGRRLYLTNLMGAGIYVVDLPADLFPAPAPDQE